VTGLAKTVRETVLLTLKLEHEKACHWIRMVEGVEDAEGENKKPLQAGRNEEVAKPGTEFRMRRWRAKSYR